MRIVLEIVDIKRLTDIIVKYILKIQEPFDSNGVERLLFPENNVYSRNKNDQKMLDPYDFGEWSCMRQ